MRKLIHIDDIMILDEFKMSHPSQKKIEKYKKIGKQIKPIILTENNTLVDGYIQYLILKENDCKWCECVYLKPITYICGIHPNGGRKEYKWKIPCSEKWDKFKTKIKYGDMIWCNTSYGITPVMITNIVTSYDYFECKDMKTVAKQKIIKSALWKNVDIDTKVLYKNNISDEWKTGYYAGLSYNKDPMIWCDGRTSWQTDIHFIPKYTVLPWNNEPEIIDNMTNMLARC